jgi:hypothetical protein
LNVIASTANSLTLQWDEVLAAWGYTILASDGSGNTVSWQAGATDTITIANLLPCTNYILSINSQCDNPQGPATLSVGFTPGCEDCALIPYCSTSANADVEFIANVSIGDIVRNSSGDDGYILVSDITDTLFVGSNYEVSCTPGYLGTTYNENFRVWIDYNIDGDFEDANELVFDPEPTTVEVTGSFTVPNSITSGVSRMRVSMAYTPINANNEPDPCGTLTYGEIEDYCITLSNAVSIQERIEAAISLAPNPANDWIQIRGLQQKPIEVALQGIDGRSYGSLNLNEWPRFTLPALTNGTYFVRVQCEKETMVLPLVIVH